MDMIAAEAAIFDRMTVTPEGCWNWLGKKRIRGYGRITVDGRQVMVHRVAYRLRRGELSDDLTIDHLCNNRACVNPDHMEPVTARENTLRAFARRGGLVTLLDATQCRRGHVYTTENTRISPSGGKACRVCHRARNRERYHRLKPTSAT